MADGSKLVLEFSSSNTEKTVKYSYNYAQTAIPLQNITTLANAIITASTLCTYALVKLTAAMIVTTSTIDYELPEEEG